MGIVIYNSLTKKKEDFAPLAPKEVKIYTCGVTVYDDCHLGHARSLFIFDCIRKYLEFRGFSVKMVRNITDVDDKIIHRAIAEKKSFEEIRTRYIDSYERDLKALEIAKADFEPRATENVHYMVDHIRQLMEKGHAYEVDGDVYFSVRLFAGYGALSGQSADEMLTAVRIEKDEKKRDPLDFSLWKKSKEGEPSWQSPWGKGRPGWHIECSTMSMRYLRSQTLDIHAGGRDLIFPHHENEIAQAEALTGKKFAKYWLHHGLLTINGKKMSKSLGNFVTIQDVLKQHEPNVLKIFFLNAHYGSAIDFTRDGLLKVEKAYAKFGEFLDKCDSLEPGASPLDSSVAMKHPETSGIRERFIAAMDDDFNTAQGLAILFELITEGNKALADPFRRKEALIYAQTLKELGGALGLSLVAPQKAKDISENERIKFADSSVLSLDLKEVERLVAERSQARREKDYKKADQIREFLKNHGIIVEDTGKG